MGNKLHHCQVYSDPTAYQAISNIERERRKKSSVKPLVYICSPFRGEVEKNTEKAKQYCRFAISHNAIPFAPHLLYPQFLDDDKPEERHQALSFGLVILDKCNELWVFGREVSAGMAQEIERAKAKGKKIRYFKEEAHE